LETLLLLLPPLRGRDPHIEEIPLQTHLLYGGQNHWQNLMIHATSANRKITMVTTRNRTRRTTRSALGIPTIGKTTAINMRDRTPRMDKGMKLRQLPNQRPKFMKYRPMRFQHQMKMAKPTMPKNKANGSTMMTIAKIIISIMALRHL
jgi:hypothetical protein